MSPTLNTVQDTLDFISRQGRHIRRAAIPLANALHISAPGFSAAYADPGLVLELTNGQSLILPRDHAEAVLNDGILNREGIHIEFM
jgi:hypothetical protein